MIRIGAHMSIAGGLVCAIRAGMALGCDTIQLFTKNNTRWDGRPLRHQEIKRFRRTHGESLIDPLVAHASYLINLASPQREQFLRSRKAFLEEIRRAEKLGITYFVIHPGSHLSGTLDDGLKRVAEAINWAHERMKGYKVRICLETAAGQGTNVGFRFEQLTRIIANVQESEKVGVCVDTCHIFAAGYDIRSHQGYQRVVNELADALGISRIKVFHLNDSKKGLGSRVDRHEHIGRGYIGIDAFRFLLNDDRFLGVPMIIETPKSTKTLDEDRANLALLRSLASRS